MISDAGETGEEGMRGACSLLARPTADYNDVDNNNNKNNNVVNVRCN
jgi:hypothetical protein